MADRNEQLSRLRELERESAEHKAISRQSLRPHQTRPLSQEQLSRERDIRRLREETFVPDVGDPWRNH
jgi:hypothetical protein